MTDTNFAPHWRDLRAHGKTPLVRHIPRSYPMLLRDGILDRVKTLSYFATGFHFSTNRMMQIQPQSLPFCGVYLIQEIGSPDGDPQEGELRFRTMVRIGFSVIIINNDGEAAELELDKSFQALTYGLLKNPAAYQYPGVEVQSYNSSNRQHIFGNAGANNETPIAELRWELVCDLGVITYPPDITDDLEVIHVEVDYPHDSDAPPIIVEYDMEQ